MSIFRFLQPPKARSPKVQESRNNKWNSGAPRAGHKVLETSRFVADTRSCSQYSRERELPVLGCVFFGDAVAVAATDL